MISCDFVDFEEALERVFQLERTPIIVDDSPDEKVCTYFGYQPDVVVYDAQAMVAVWSLRYQQSSQTGPNSAETVVEPILDVKDGLLELLEPLRRALVEAMKFGKLLAIRLGTSVPDFTHKFSDDALGIDNTQRGSAYFPLEAFGRGGHLLREPEPAASHSSRITTLEGAHREHTWAERLFKEDDMKPHRNVAFCRDTFRLCLVSSLPSSQAAEYMFGRQATTVSDGVQNGLSLSESSSGEDTASGLLPDRKLFTFLVVMHES